MHEAETSFLHTVSELSITDFGAETLLPCGKRRWSKLLGHHVRMLPDKPERNPGVSQNSLEISCDLGTPQEVLESMGVGKDIWNT